MRPSPTTTMVATTVTKTIAILIGVAMPGCSNAAGDAVLDVSTADVAPIGEVAAADSSDDAVRCGMEGEGYVGPCDLHFELDAISTLCDESRGSCTLPSPACEGGWCYIPAMSYRSGTSLEGLPNSEDAAITVVRRDFMIGQTEVTVAQFGRLMDYLPPQQSACGSDCPVVSVNQFEAMEYANRLSNLEGRKQCYELVNCGEAEASAWTCANSKLDPDCAGYRLPTAGEWELASRAGSPGCSAFGALVPPFSFGSTCPAESPSGVGTWFCGNSGVEYKPCVDLAAKNGPTCAGLHPVGLLAPNPFGLFDTNGNAAELTQTIWTAELGGRIRLPLLVLQAGDGDTLIKADDVLTEMGGNFLVTIEYVCSHDRAPAVTVPSPLGVGTTGFRLIRRL